MPIIMPINKTGFKITIYCGSVPLSYLFGNWIQSCQSAGSTSSLESWHRTDSSNRRMCQSFWSPVVALSSPHSLWYWIIAASFCVRHFSPPLHHRRKRKASGTGGNSPPDTHIHTHTYLLKGTEDVVIPAPQETEGFERWRWKERNGLLEREGDQQTATAHEVTGREVFEVFVHVLF